ncbi:sulfur carrier protein [Oceanisphaera litoralis]|uniref:sulfur carrier protein ThiS n=1 Tax=Oceanisphaera TaxID=225143 RepID=UPI001957E44E|nr:sulfur carrier protein ThiS [Oceanisphaera litoralis]MBM7456982.1 sulfur carrier protein [Oceanisphaera litoralis]
MRVVLNDEALDLAEGTTLGQLLVTLEQDKPGVAVALNQQVVARSQWGEQQLTPNDNITLFHAIAGG